MAIGEVDCLEIVNTLHDDRFKYHKLAFEFSEIWSLLLRPCSFQLKHILRSANDAANCLAGSATDIQCATFRLETPPSQLDPILARDLLAL